MPNSLTSFWWIAIAIATAAGAVMEMTESMLVMFFL